MRTVLIEISRLRALVKVKLRLTPKEEAWLFKNKEAYHALANGMEQAREGKTHDLGSFEEYL